MWLGRTPWGQADPTGEKRSKITPSTVSGYRMPVKRSTSSELVWMFSAASSSKIMIWRNRVGSYTSSSDR